MYSKSVAQKMALLRNWAHSLSADVAHDGMYTKPDVLYIELDAIFVLKWMHERTCFDLINS